MIPILSNDAMRNADRRGIEGLGIPSLALMESAGRAIADEAGRIIAGTATATLAGKRLLVVCGTGNNGGDGFVAARHLLNRGAEVWMRLIGPREKIDGDALAMLHPLERLREMKGMKFQGHIDELQPMELDTLSYIRFDLVIDAIFGTGLSGVLREPALLAVDLMKRLRKEGIPILAVDIPSGVSGDTGEVLGDCAGATVTVTFAAPKLGHLLEPGKTLRGELLTHDIGLPTEILHELATAHAPELSDVQLALPTIAPDAHKGTRGKLFVLGGSMGLTGAISLTANAAVRTGAGLVVVGTPETAEAVVASKLLEAMTVALPDRNGRLSEEAVAALPHWSDWSHAWVIGPGMGRDVGVTTLVRLVYENVEQPMVVDADALFALAETANETGVMPRPGGVRILTPHTNEFANLTGMRINEFVANRVEAARHFAQTNRVVLVLKGAPTIIASPDGRIAINSTGNAALATGGSGDVLAGMIGALLARMTLQKEYDPFTAAFAAVWMHGRVADHWVDAGGSVSAFYAQAILDGLPQVLAEVT
ncbi:MAG: NAD(P)H-hydrate dehydratase [bacterium]|nr:NAD(P)H-hydrate dehydratase [bacterium]